MYTINQFENALIAINVQIQELKTLKSKVREAVGYKDGKRLTWNEQGQCFFYTKRLPDNDLKFNNLISE